MVFGPGDFVGDTAILGDAPHSASVISQTRMRVLVAGPQTIAALLNHPGVLRRMATNLARRLRGADAP